MRTKNRKDLFQVMSEKIHTAHWVHYMVIWTEPSEKVSSSMPKTCGSHHSAHAQDLIRAFVLHLYIPMTLEADSAGPDQTARMRRLIWPSLSAYARRHAFAWRDPYVFYWVHNMCYFDTNASVILGT